MISLLNRLYADYLMPIFQQQVANLTGNKPRRAGNQKCIHYSLTTFG